MIHIVLQNMCHLMGREKKRNKILVQKRDGIMEQKIIKVFSVKVFHWQ